MGAKFMGLSNEFEAQTLRPGLQIRVARHQDAPELARIYHQATQDNLATFESFLVHPEDQQQWMREHSENYPLLVAEGNGKILGWASLQPYHARPRIPGIVELLIYVDRDYRRHGVGRELMRAIEARARASGHFKIIGRFLAHNEASRKLCRLGGWHEVGIHQKHTQLDGRWYDVVVVEFLIPENLARRNS
jgi:phosphinothricin acetyltransferase